jgi:putative FmdB family regulatory protein
MVMPTYLFRCEDCSQEFELKMSWRDKATAKCAHCGGQKLKELFGQYTFQVASRHSTTTPKECSPETCHSCAHSGAGCLSHQT